MTQNGFLGTIGWIKSNLMVSSQASEKGYNNENFYPGAENIPESEPKGPLVPPSGATLLKDLSYTPWYGAYITDDMMYLNGEQHYVEVNEPIKFRLGNTIYNNGLVLKFLYCAYNGGIPATYQGSITPITGYTSGGRLELANDNSAYSAPYRFNFVHSQGTNNIQTSRIIQPDTWYYIRLLFNEAKPIIEVYDSNKTLIESKSANYSTNTANIKFVLWHFGALGNYNTTRARFDLSESFYW